MSLSGLLMIAAVHLLINFTLLNSQSIGDSHFESHAYNLRRFLEAAISGKECEFIASSQLTNTEDPGQPTASRFNVNDAFGSNSSGSKPCNLVWTAACL